MRRRWQPCHKLEFETATPWTLGTHHRYRGPTLKSVLAAQQVDSASAIDVAALNGYQQRVDLSPVCQGAADPGALPG